jgi:hypothetical protein
MIHHHFWGFHTGPSLVVVVLLIAALVWGLADDPRRILAGIAIALLVLFCLGGCATVQEDGELAWQAGNLVDIGQTVTIARRPGEWTEVDPIAVATIGHHPTESNAVALLAGEAVLHYAVFRWLEDEDEAHPDSGWHTALDTWECVSIGTKGIYIARNQAEGIGMFQSRRP